MLWVIVENISQYIKIKKNNYNLFYKHSFSISIQSKNKLFRHNNERYLLWFIHLGKCLV